MGLPVRGAYPKIRSNLSAMKVLVTGATGFIGNYVVEELLKLRIQVIATSAHVIKAKEKPWFNSVKYIEHDIYLDTQEDLYKKFESPDKLIHLSWGNLSNFKSTVHIQKELPANQKFLENLIIHGLKDLTISGTCLEYGLQEGCLSEDMESKPTVAYSIAKHQLHLYLETFKNKHALSLKWVRLFYMYGNGQAPKSILPQLDKAIENGDKVFNMTKGDQIRDYLPVSKVSESIVIFALQRKIDGVINCCSGEGITVEKLIKDHLKKINKNIELNLGYYPYPDYEPMRFWGSTEKIKKILNDKMSFDW